VAGPINGLIYDLGRKRFYAIPAVFAELINDANGKWVAAFLETLPSEVHSRFWEVADFLISNQIAGLFSASKVFKELPSEIDGPGHIQNAIIDVDEQLHDFANIVRELDLLGCEFLQVRSYSDALNVQMLDEIALVVERSGLRGLEYIVKYNAGHSQEDLSKLLLDHMIISKLVVHSSPETTAVPVCYPDSPVPRREIYYTVEALRSCTDCGKINRRSISPPSAQTFFQLKRVNGCLYKKISIGADGEVRNCPSSSGSYGRYSFGTLSKAIFDAEFRRSWDVHKDQISTCKVCEYRYACTDCRVYLQNPTDILSKPAKCCYDPYVGKWSEETGKMVSDHRFQAVT